MSIAHELVELAQTLSKALSNYPEDIRVEAISQESGVIDLLIHSQYVDIGPILGKMGRNIQAMRTILSAVGAKHRVKTTLRIKESP